MTLNNIVCIPHLLYAPWLTDPIFESLTQLGSHTWAPVFSQWLHIYIHLRISSPSSENNRKEGLKFITSKEREIVPIVPIVIVCMVMMEMVLLSLCLPLSLSPHLCVCVTIPYQIRMRGSHTKEKRYNSVAEVLYLNACYLLKFGSETFSQSTLQLYLWDDFC